MTSWQKRLRVGLAIFGIVFAGLVYRSIGERRLAVPSQPVDRMDPKAILETTQAVLQQVRGTEQEFEIKSQRTLTYEDGSAKHFNVEITVRRTEGRVFVITAGEAQAGPKQVELQLSGGVKVSVNDGFELVTDHGTFNQNESLARAPGDVTFKKGLMSGSGANATYNHKSDVLDIAERARVLVKDQAGGTSLDGAAGHATLDRTQNVLFMDSSVHVLRGGQIMDADKVMALLSENEEVVRHLELRGGASVEGGDSPLQSMKANAIDLDYSDDGTVLRRALLNGSARCRTAADEHASSRHMSGESIDVQIAPDGSLSSMAGRDKVQLDLPETDGAPSRSIRAAALDAGAEAGARIDTFRFRGDVVFQESVRADASSREVRAQSLTASLEGDGITSAHFSGGVTFKEQGLEAGAAEARYRPAQNALSLDSENGPRPYVTDDQIHVEAQTIDVKLDNHAMTASGNVRTSIRGRAAGAKTSEGGRLPGLLKEGQPASVNAEQLDYRGSNGRAEYTGIATLVQGDTAIRGDRLVLDQQKGDMVASGSARSTLVLDKGRMEGRGNEIRYSDSMRTVTYSSAAAALTTGSAAVAPTTGAAAVAPTTGSAAAAQATGPPAPTPLAQVAGPDGDLRAQRIEVVLAGDNAVERLEAYTRVTIVLGARTASGGRLTYHAQEERYVMSGMGATPVTFRESCRETTGRTLTFFKSTERIVVDGNERSRTETKPCTPLQPPPQPAVPRPSPATR
jgi:lipopolysaccharide transport protein LptA